MAAMHDGEAETGHDVGNIHRKRAREETNWSAAVSQELLRLRFRQLRGLFDDAQTVADVHEAWGVVASTLNSKEELGLHTDAVKCSDQLTKLRQQWQESSTAQLHLMMAECFSSGNNSSDSQQQPAQPSSPARNNFNRAMEEAVREAEAVRGDASPKRSKTTPGAQQAEGALLPPSAEPAPAPSHQAKTLLSPEPAPTSPTSAAHDAASSSQHEAPLSPEPAPVSTQPVSSTPQEAPLSVDPVEEEEFPRQDEIMRALEKRSQQLERLAQSHQHLTDVTQQLMEALVNRRSINP